jgi:carboxymethylenebutenolidase
MGHGWTVSDHGVYDEQGAERHWTRLTTLFAECLS